MELSEDIIRFGSALLFVVALMLLLAWVLRLFSGGGAGGAGRRRRVEVVVSTTMDARRKLALVRRDDVEHLLILSPSGETVIETGIYAPIETRSATKALSAPRRHED